jgi:PAS domain S-box-containing protein
LGKLPVGMTIYHLADPGDDRTLRLVYLNEAAAATLGVPGETVLGLGIDAVFPGLRALGFPQAYAAIARSGVAREWEAVTYSDQRVKEAVFQVSAQALPGNHVAVAFKDITERMKVIESERNFRSLAENSPDIVARFDLQGRYLYINPAGTTATGWPLEDFIGKRFRDLPFSEVNIAQWEAQLARVIQTGAPDTIETQVPLHGVPRWFQLKAVPEFDREGRLESVMRISHDVTNRVLAATLEVEQELTQAHADRLQELNEELGAQHEELLAQQEELNHVHAELQRHTEALERELAHSQRMDSYLVLQYDLMRLLAEATSHQDAFSRLLEGIGRQLGWTTGEVWLVAGDRLSRTQTWSSGRAPDATFLAARGALQLMPGQGLAGRAWAQRQPVWLEEIQDASGLPSQAEAVAAGLHTAMAVPVMAQGEVLAIVTLFTQQRLATNAELMLLGEAIGETLGQIMHRKSAELALEVAHDRLSVAYADMARQAQELELQRDALALANQEAERLGRLKDEFLSVVSHELRTPLAAIRNAASILKKHRAGLLNETQARFVAMIEEHVTRLTLLVDDILDMQKLEHGSFRADLVRQDLNATIRSVALSYASVLEGCQLRFELELADEPLEAPLDAHLIGQVVMNLLSNASKFTPQGGTVRVRTWREGREVCVSVSDTGIGIAEEHHDRIFQKFVQVGDRLSRGSGGTGLGLAICRQLLHEAHGGRLWLESQPGEGSTFAFALPAA